MPDTSTATPGITSQRDRIAILEDLVEFHTQHSAAAARLLLRIAEELAGEDLAKASPEELRANNAIVRLALTQVAHELACGNLDIVKAMTALGGWPFMAQPSRMLS